MKEYVELILLENAIIHFLLFYSFVQALHIRAKTKKIIFFSLILGCFSASIGIYSTVIAILSIILTFSLLLFLSKPIAILQGIKEIAVYLEIVFLYLAIIIAITICFKINLSVLWYRIIVYVIAYLLTNVCNRILWKQLKETITMQHLLYSITINGKRYRIFLDTGNSLKDTTNSRDVIILNEDTYLKKNKSSLLDLGSKEGYVLEARTIFSKDKLLGYSFSNVEIVDWQNKKRTLSSVLIVFSNLTSKKYDGIMSIHTYLDKIKGEEYELHGQN